MRWNTSHHRSADRACRLRGVLAYSGTDSFTYAAGDSYGGSATATVRLTVHRTTRAGPDRRPRFLGQPRPGRPPQHQRSARTARPRRQPRRLGADGAQTALLIGAGALLLVAGAGAIVLARRRCPRAGDSGVRPGPAMTVPTGRRPPGHVIAQGAAGRPGKPTQPRRSR